MIRQRIRSSFYRVGLKGIGFLHLPNCLMRFIIRVCLASIAGKTPRSAMKAFLLIDNDLTAMINRTAILYDGGIHVKHRLMRYHDFFIQRIRPGERVLDIGCGNGALSFDLVKCAGAIVTGIDIEQKNVGLARERYQHQRLRFVCGDATKSLPDESFDVIVLSNVLEHIRDRVRFVQRIKDKIRHGRYLVRVPMIDRDWHVPLRKELGLSYYSDATHFTEYTKLSFEQEIASFGLKLVHSQINWGEIWAEIEAGDGSG